MQYNSHANSRFLGFFGLFIVVGIALFWVMLCGLRAVHSLPAPPLAATSCIDEKFKYLAEQAIDNVDFLAIGSSVTWRNLDLTPFIPAGITSDPLNAAPCYLNFHQTAFLGEFLLDHLNHVKTVMTIVAPRDFEQCSQGDRTFFDRDQAASYVFGHGSPFLIYATNFRPLPFFKDAVAVARRRSDIAVPGGSVVMGPFGAGPIEGHIDEAIDWPPPAVLDKECFRALTAFEQFLKGRGLEFIVIRFPTRPSLRPKGDSQREIEDNFDRQLRESLHAETTMLIPGRTLLDDHTDYFDNVHFSWHGAQAFSVALANQIQSMTASTIHQKGM